MKNIRTEIVCYATFTDIWSFLEEYDEVICEALGLEELNLEDLDACYSILDKYLEHKSTDTKRFFYIEADEHCDFFGVYYVILSNLKGGE